MARDYGKFGDIRIPPESSGPQVYSTLYQSLNLTSVGGTMIPGQDIVGQASGCTGEIVEVSGDSILVVVSSTSPVQSFNNSETVEINSAAFTAIISSFTEQYVNTTQIVDSDNPHKIQKVSRRGSAHIRFAEGEQQLDAFGLTKTVSRDMLAYWTFQYSPLPEGLYESITGAASSTHLPLESSLRLDVTSAASDNIYLQSDVYFPYVPGVGREAVYTLACGDAGKTGNVRRWGLFDDDNGVFFELEGTTLYVVVRSNTTGTPVDTRVAQQSWNGDHLDGTFDLDNPSGINLDITKYNIYWIDYAWLGAGRVRLGVYAPNGDRILVHQFENSNSLSSVYMTTGSLPARAENFNTALTSGSSSLKLTCGAIANSHANVVPNYFPTYAYVRTGVAVTTETVLWNLRTPTTLGGLANRIISRGLVGSTVSDTAPAVIRIYENTTIGGSPVWNNADGNGNSPLEVDTAGTFSGGKLVASFVSGPNETETTPLEFLSVYLLGGGTSKTYTVTGESLGAATNISGTFTWVDEG